MTAPIYAVCAVDPAVRGLIPDGTSDIRLYPFGSAPQGVIKPYAVWQVIGGSPENFLAGRPNIDAYALQVDVYGDTGREVQAVGRALRYAVELVATVTGFGPENRDTETKSYRHSFDVGWLVRR